MACLSLTTALPLRRGSLFSGNLFRRSFAPSSFTHFFSATANGSPAEPKPIDCLPNPFMRRGPIGPFEWWTSVWGARFRVDMPGVEPARLKTWVEGNSVFFEGSEDPALLGHECRVYQGSIDFDSEPSQFRAQDFSAELLDGIFWFQIFSHDPYETHVPLKIFNNEILENCSKLFYPLLKFGPKCCFSGKRTKEAAVISVDMPGASKADLKVNITEGKKIHFSAEASQQHRFEAETDLNYELRCYVGAIELEPLTYDIEQVKTELNHGVLRIVVPRREKLADYGSESNDQPDVIWFQFSRHRALMMSHLQ